jgi:hypothetical protein
MQLKNTQQVSLAEWKRARAAAPKPKGKKAAHSEFIHPDTHGLTTMFVPTRTAGKAIFEVTSRKEFLNSTINDWLKWHMYRGLGITFGILSLWLLTINPFLAALGGLATGWAFGWHYRWSRAMDILRKRDLLEAV